ncbi:MAG: hypothetical protein WA304_10595 [Candidatus Cybelea sp.]
MIIQLCGAVCDRSHAAGRPQPYTIAAIFADYMCGYDDRGNLVIDGLGLHGHAAFAILEHGSTKFFSALWRL